MIRLPRFTLLCGPKSAGKSTLARLLQEQDTQLCVASFAEPIRLALLSTFYPEEMTLGIDLRDEAVKARQIPGTNVTNRRWMMEFGDWMKTQFTPYVFVDIAKRMIEMQRPYWARFLFDDCRFLEEVDGLAGGYGRENLLIIHIERQSDPPGGHRLENVHGVTGRQDTVITGPSFPIPSISRLAIRNDLEPEAMLAQLRSHLGEWNERKPEVPSTDL